MSLQAAWSLDNQDDGGGLAGSPHTALYRVRRAVHANHSENPTSQGGMETTANPHIAALPLRETEC